MKELIDKYFIENYTKLVSLADAKINMMNKQIEAASVVSSAYIYIVSKSDNLTQKEIAPLAIGFICMEISLYNTKTNRKEQVRGSEIDFIDEPFNQESDLILNLDIEGFVNTLDRLDTILWDVYYVRGIQTKRDIAEHFNIDPSSALIYINRVKEKYREYVKS